MLALGIWAWFFERMARTMALPQIRFPLGVFHIESVR